MYLHPKFQQAAQSNKKFIVPYGGRAGMKTLSTGKVLLAKALGEIDTRILCTRRYQNKLSQSVYTVLVMLISKFPEFKDRFLVQRDKIVCTDTGSEFLFQGMQKIEEIKSLEGVKFVWLEEANYLDEEAFETLSKTIRVPGAQIYVVFNPYLEEDYVYQRFVVNSDPMAFVFKLSWKDNPFFKEEFVGTLVQEREYDEQKDKQKYQHIWEGECIANVEGALFKPDWFKYESIDSTTLDKIVVAIDPSGTSHKDSDACGLVVAGKLGNYYYVLDDQTKILTPSQWAHQAINLYRKWLANEIIYESNFGGDMVPTILRQIDSKVPVRKVVASRGKMLRAEPIASLYEQGLVKHLRRFQDLEYEATTYTGDPKQKSPNRLDAMVWALASLSARNIIYPKGMKPGDMGKMRLRTTPLPINPMRF